MKTKAFTLVELLAVIAILAIILIIAYPLITNVIKQARLNTFNSSGELLEKATQTYLASNSISIADGETTTIDYTDVKESGFVKKIVDPISRTECIDSKIYVTNDGGNYEYDAGLICENFIDLDTYNLLFNGDFSNGTTGWYCVGGSITVTDNILTSVGIGSSTSACDFWRTQTSYTLNHKIFVYFKVRVTNSVAEYIKLNLYNFTGTSFEVIDPIENRWYDLYTIGTVSSSGSNLTFGVNNRYDLKATAAGKIMEIDGNVGVYAIDLTEIYGTNNEPNADKVFIVIKNMTN